MNKKKIEIKILSLLIIILSLTIVACFNFLIISFLCTKQWNQTELSILIFIRRILPPIMIIINDKIQYSKFKAFILSITIFINCAALELLFPNFLLCLICTGFISFTQIAMNQSLSNLLEYISTNPLISRAIQDFTKLFGFGLTFLQIKDILTIFMSLSINSIFLALNNNNYFENYKKSTEQNSIENKIEPIRINKIYWKHLIFLGVFLSLSAIYNNYLFLALKESFQISKESTYEPMIFFLLGPILLSIPIYQTLKFFHNNDKKIICIFILKICIGFSILFAIKFNYLNLIKYGLLMMGSFVGLARILITQRLMKNNFINSSLFPKIDAFVNLIIAFVGIYLKLNLELITMGTILISSLCSIIFFI